MKVNRVGIFVLAVVAVVVTSCVIEMDEFAPKQRSQIESYLSQKEYTITSDSAFVHLAGNKFNIAAENRPVGAEVGDRVKFNIESYTFTSSPSSEPFYTNKRYLVESISDELNTEYWDFEPRVVTLGSGEILNALDESLRGSIAGDSLLVFLTSSIAYGEDGLGAVPANTAVMMILTVENLSKRVK